MQTRHLLSLVVGTIAALVAVYKLVRKRGLKKNALLKNPQWLDVEIRTTQTLYDAAVKKSEIARILGRSLGAVHSTIRGFDTKRREAIIEHVCGCGEQYIALPRTDWCPKCTMKKWKGKNPNYVRDWKIRNPEKARMLSTRDNNRRRAICGEFSAIEWTAIVKKQGGRCAHCRSRKKLTVDHIVPVSRGGCNYAFNLQALCVSCNSKKHNRLDTIVVSLFDEIRSA